MALEGKTLRGSFQVADKSDAVHLISVWAATNGLTLGQLLVDSKSNEITAAPKLLERLDVEGWVVSLDALGCQKKIATAIRRAGADSLLALKANWPLLDGEVRSLFGDAQALEAARRDGTTTRQGRYYLTNLPADAELLLKLARRHWSIENQCHRVMDVVYGEDASRARKGHAAENLAQLRRLSHNLLENANSVRDSIAGKPKRACLSTNTLETLLKPRNPK